MPDCVLPYHESYPLARDGDIHQLDFVESRAVRILAEVPLVSHESILIKDLEARDGGHFCDIGTQTAKQANKAFKCL